MLPRMMPSPMGTRRSGSKSFLMASQMKSAPTRYHGEVSCRGVGKARIGQELIEVLYDEIHNLL